MARRTDLDKAVVHIEDPDGTRRVVHTYHGNNCDLQARAHVQRLQAGAVRGTESKITYVWTPGPNR